MRNPAVIGEINAIHITDTTSTKMYRELWWLKSTVGRLRSRREGERKNNEYETKLLQRLIHFTLKATKNGEYSLNDGMKGRFQVISFNTCRSYSQSLRFCGYVLFHSAGLCCEVPRTRFQTNEN